MYVPHSKGSQLEVWIDGKRYLVTVTGANSTTIVGKAEDGEYVTISKR